MELEVQKYASASAGKVKTAEAVNGLPQPLALGV
jgi:hypothetical protein